MIITPNELINLDNKYNNIPINNLTRYIEAVESCIRSYTNNTFSNREVRAVYLCNGYTMQLAKGTNFFDINDTVCITKGINKGVYTVTAVEGEKVTVNKKMIEEINIVSRVDYPHDVVIGAVNMLDWQIFKREKIGLASESISRHSVSYINYDSNNTISGFPSSIMGFLAPYKKART